MKSWLTTVALPILAASVVGGCERPPMVVTQTGYRGLAMQQVSDPRLQAGRRDINAVPPAPPRPTLPEGTPLAGTTLKNVQVLKDVPVPEFTRLMTAITAWVAPQQGCVYCHAAADLSSDALYTKVVARRMLQMTEHLNHDWKSHVAETGVTCYTCHRGQPVPAYIWHTDPGPTLMSTYAGAKRGQNAPSDNVRLAALPNDPFATFLDGHPQDITVISRTALREDGMGQSIQQTEQTYGLMMHITGALGVNCTFCHNSRSFFDWDQSTPQRATAWYGIRLVRDLNDHYLTPLTSHFPPQRLGPEGDAPKLDCATCHQGAHKPLNGVSMVKDYPELKGGKYKAD